MKKNISRLIKRLVKNQLLRGSFVLLIGSGVGNFGNYAYHLLMGRMLGPADYGALGALISLLSILSIPMSAISLVTVKKIAEFRGRGEYGKITGYYQGMGRKLLKPSLIIFFLLSLTSPFTGRFLHLESVGSVLTVVAYSLINVFLVINSAFLTAFLNFAKVSWLGIFQTAIKLIAGLFLVRLGLSVLGGILPFLICGFFGLVLSRLWLRNLLANLKNSNQNLGLDRIFQEAIPFFLVNLSFTSLYTADVVLARHFLPAKEAGFYTALSVLGKIIFFACGPVATVLFPITAQRRTAGKNYRRVFLLSLILVFLITGAIALLYFLFPNLMMRLLFGNQYAEAESYLFIFALVFSFYSLANLVSQFFLSISLNQSIFLPVLAAATQILLIILYHQNLAQIAWISVGVCGLLFTLLMVYFFTLTKD